MCEVLGSYWLQICGYDGQVESVGVGEDVESIDRPADIEKLEAWEEDNAEVLG